MDFKPQKVLHLKDELAKKNPKLQREDITQDYIRALLSYDKDTGNFFWLMDRNPKALKGAQAGTINRHGYRIINIQGILTVDARLAFLYIEGRLPKEIDHIDNNPLNCKWENLREVTKSQNQHNKLLQGNNTSGIKGVSFHKPSGNWRGTIKFKSKSYSTKYFETPEEARDSLQLLRVKLHKEYSNHG